MKILNITILFILIFLNLCSASVSKRELDQKMLDAVWNGEYSNVKFFLEKGADVNATDEEGYTALHRVATNGNFEIAGLLIEAGADVNQMNEKNPVTALYRAIEHGYPKIVELLIKHGVDLNRALSEHNWMPLHMAAYYGYPGIARLLIDGGADLDQVTNNGLTALAVASLPIHHEIRSDWVEEVIRQGGNRHDEVRKLLIDAKAPLDAAFSFYLNDFIKSYGSAIGVVAVNAFFVTYYFLMYADYMPALDMNEVLMP